MKVITYSALRSDITEETTLVSRIHSRALALLTAVALVSPPSRTPARTTATPSPPPRTSTRRRPSGQTTRSSSNPSSQAQRLPWTTLLRGLEKVTGATAGINTSSRCPTMASSTFWRTRRDLLHRTGCYLGIPTANLDGVWGRRWASHESFPRSHRLTRPSLSKWSRQRRAV